MKFKEFLFTGFYSGYVPFAPGTAGTFVGMILYVLGYLIFGEISWIVNLVVVLLMLYPAVKLGDSGEEFFGVKDPPQVVLDEVMGYWISVLFFPFNMKIAIAGFLIFRVMDILKPFPAGKLQEIRGGLGIMIDDYIAGIYSCLLLHMTVRLFGYFNISFF